MQNSALKIVSALDDYYFEHVRVNAVSPVTVENNICNLKTYFGNEKALKDVDIPACRGYANFRNAKPSTIAKELGTLKASAHHAVKWKRLSLAEMPTFEMPKVVYDKAAWLFEDELAALMDGARAIKEPIPLRTLSFIELAYYAAGRRESIETLTWSQVDITRRRISLAKPGEAQTKKRRPIVAMDPKLVLTMERLLADKYSNFVLGHGTRMDAWFDSAAAAGGVLHLPERENRPAVINTPHMLRHSRATHPLQAGKSLWAVANLLGDTVATVERIYGHHCPTHTEILFN